MTLRKLREKLDKPLLLDGAIGTCLIGRNPETNFSKKIWTSCLSLSDPLSVYNLHLEYINAGADIITANTFRSNPEAVALSGISSEDAVRSSIEIARKAVYECCSKKTVLVAGSNAPAEDCWKKERGIPQNTLEYNHKKHIELLINHGADFILNETFSQMDEILIVSCFCKENNIPYVISLYFDTELKLLDGTPLNEAIAAISELAPEAVSANCIPPSRFFRAYNFYKDISNGFYFNASDSDVSSGFPESRIPPKFFADDIKRYLNSNTIFAGSCCGTDPFYTKTIRETLDEIN